jgi:hypothetical protein
LTAHIARFFRGHADIADFSGLPETGEVVQRAQKNAPSLNAVW